MDKRYVVLIAVIALAVLPAVVSANARLISVTSVSGGCVSGPTGPSVQHWDVEPGETYRLRISHVAECANGGTDAMLNVRIYSTTHGNTDLVATKVADGVYEFEYTMPSNAVCTFPIRYCTTPGQNNTGIWVNRNDGGGFQAHLRASTFEAGCTNPMERIGEECGVVPTEESSWGEIKSTYE